MDAPKIVSTLATAARGIGLMGIASAIIIALFTALATRFEITAFLLAAGAAWWAACEGLAWAFQRNAERLAREVDRSDRSRARDYTARARSRV